MTPERKAVLRGVVFLVAGLVAFGGLASQIESEPSSVTERLRYTSVYVAADAEWVLDPEQTRRIVGDRPLVVAAGQDETCDELADAFPDVTVIVVSYDPDRPIDDCGGRDPVLLPAALEAMTFVEAGSDRTQYVRAGAGRPSRTPA